MEDKYRGEQILVFERSLLESLGMFHGTSTEVEHYLRPILDEGRTRFHPRYLAEEDPGLQQIIPYVVFRHGDTVFSYVRGKKAGESRLVGNRSIGVGGHINPVDATTSLGHSQHATRATYLEAVRREIEEEVIVDGPFEPHMCAVLKDDSNAVGTVHFGVIHICELRGPSVRRREQQLTQSGFVPIAQLQGAQREELETWSQLAIDLVATRRPVH
jgi:predicted NUDIX family phosphoesterase